MTGGGFDRVRPRRPSAPRPAGRGRDTDGTRALYSPGGPAAAPPRGVDAGPATVTVACTRCGVRSRLPIRRALLRLLPSLHLPYLRAHPSLLRCPACGRFAWVDLRLHL